MDTGTILVAIIAIVAIAAIAWYGYQQRRSQGLQDRFGPEYERTVEASPNRRDAERDLIDRQQRVEALDIRPLDAASRDRFRERWRSVQAMFVDDPGGAVGEADALIGDVMRARGYPVGDFEQRAADISVDHPQVVDHYRTAHAIAVRRRTGEDATEQLRQAFLHYRALFADLLETDEPEPAGAAPDTGVQRGAVARGAVPGGAVPTRDATTTRSTDARSRR